MTATMTHDTATTTNTPMISTCTELIERAIACTAHSHWPAITGWVREEIIFATEDRATTYLERALVIAEPRLQMESDKALCDTRRSELIARAKRIYDNNGTIWNELREGFYTRMVMLAVCERITPKKIHDVIRAIEVLEGVVLRKQGKALVGRNEFTLRRMGLTGTSPVGAQRRGGRTAAQRNRSAQDAAFRNSCRGSSAEIPLHPQQGKKAKK